MTVNNFRKIFCTRVRNGAKPKWRQNIKAETFLFMFAAKKMLSDCLFIYYTVYIHTFYAGPSVY